MGLKIKNFNIMKVHWKIRFLGGGFTKNQYIAGIAWKRGAWTVCKVKEGGLAKKRGLADTPMHNISHSYILSE